MMSSKSRFPSTSELGGKNIVPFDSERGTWMRLSDHCQTKTNEDVHVHKYIGNKTSMNKTGPKLYHPKDSLARDYLVGLYQISHQTLCRMHVLLSPAFLELHLSILSDCSMPLSSALGIIGEGKTQRRQLTTSSKSNPVAVRI